MEQNKDIAVLTKIFGKPESEVKEKLFTEKDGVLIKNEDYEEILYSWDAERVKRFKEKETIAHDNGYKKAQKEVLTDYEKQLKAIGILNEGEQGIETVITNINNLRKEQGKSKLTDDEVKLHPLYLAYEDKIKKEYIPKSEYESKTKEYEEKLNNIAHKERIYKVSDEAMKVFNPDEYQLSSDVTRRNNQIVLFKDLLLKQIDDIEITQNGKMILIKDGKRLEDEHGNIIQLSEVINNMANQLFDKKAPTQKGSAGNNNNNYEKQKDNKYKFEAKNEQELLVERNKLQNEATTYEEKLLISKLAIEYAKLLK